MKVEVKDKANEIKLPCLMVGKNTGQLVLFISKNSGLAIGNYHTKEDFEYIDCFTDYNNTDIWTKFHGEVILKND